MKFLPYLLKHLRRNWVRTTSTVAAMAVCLFLFCTLQSVLAAVDILLEATSASRLVTRNKTSIVFPLPLSYGSRIQSVPGVKRVATTAWFGGSLPVKLEGKSVEEDEAAEKEASQDWSRFIPSLAVDPEPLFAMYPEYQVKPEEWQAFLQDMQGTMIGRKLADKYGWKVGDHFFLESFIPVYRKASGPFEFVVRGIFDVDRGKHPGTDTNVMYFQYKYLYEATGRTVKAGHYTLEIDSPDNGGSISKAIDTMFENSDAQTHTETEKAFALSFISMAGNLTMLLNAIGLAVAFTILLVTANTMSMAVRERRTEIAVLKTLGFSSGTVMGLIVAEGVLLGLLGGLLGIGGSQALMWVLTVVPTIRDALAGMGISSLHLPPTVAAVSFGVALLLGFVAGFAPAWGAYRARITDMLRTV